MPSTVWIGQKPVRPWDGLRSFMSQIDQHELHHNSGLENIFQLLSSELYLVAMSNRICDVGLCLKGGEVCSHCVLCVV